MILYYTPLSHFSRKVRILMAGLGLEADLVDVGNAAEADINQFGGNPLMTVPVLRDGELTIYDSDAIAEYLVHRYDPADRFRVLARDALRRNARVVMNGIMSAEAELVLAARTGMDTHAHRRFEKKRQVIGNGLTWLESHVASLPTTPDYLAFHLVSLWEHLVVFRNLPEIALPRIASRVADIQRLEMVTASRPQP